MKIMFNFDDMLMYVKKFKEWLDKGYYKYYGSDWDVN